AAQIAPAYVTLIRDDSNDIIWMVLREIGVMIIQRAAHLVCVFLIYTKNNGLREAVILPHELGDVFCNCLSPCLQHQQPIELWCAIDRVGNLPTVSVSFAFGWSPSCGINGRDDTVNAIRS